MIPFSATANTSSGLANGLYGLDRADRAGRRTTPTRLEDFFVDGMVGVDVRSEGFEHRTNGEIVEEADAVHHPQVRQDLHPLGPEHPVQALGGRHRHQPRAGHERRAGGRAERADVKIRETNRFTIQRIEIGRLDNRIPMTSKVTIALIVRHDDDGLQQ